MPRQPSKPSLPFPTRESVDTAKTAAPAAPAVKKPAAKPAAKSARKAPPKPAAEVPTKAPAAAPVVAPTAHSVYPFEIQNKALRKLWQQWQPGEPRDSRTVAELSPAPVNLQKFDPAAKPFSANKGKQHDKDTAAQLATELDGLQNIFYADRSFKLLVILQGMDAAGKDGTLRGVFGQMTPLGVRTVGWKAPTDVEKAHDYLWRIHQQVPGAGEVVVFNRSQYEDVLVPVVNRFITPEQQAQRYAQINDFERMLSETGTIVLKFMLHISKDEQRQRLQERLDDPCKHWKFDENDLKVRSQWDDYQQAYEQLLAATHTPWAPWTIVPADSKTHRNLMIATMLREVLGNLDLKYPPGAPAMDKIKVK
ncbi:MAG: polyphosphate--nucleotide phosphotransferase [Comamonas sp.]